MKDHMDAFANRLKAQARQLGFDLVGIAPAVTPPGTEALREWLANGYAGEMRYMQRQEAARQHPESIVPDARSVIMVAVNYRQQADKRQQARGNRQQEDEAGLLTGRISCYASGEDYHHVLWRRLDELLAWLKRERPECQGRAVVDTAPLLERDYARLAGLGWFGKNTMLLHKRLGSFFFLGALIVNIDLAADEPFETSHCGTCTACLDACPTRAFTAPGQLDARRCISYLTIELRGQVPAELRSGMGDWIFGCDICQDVCPWNRKAPVSAEPALQPREELTNANLVELLRLSPAAFRERFRDTAITRTKRRGLLRNAAIALGNSGDIRALPVLMEALGDEEPLVRGAAAWALGRLQSQAAHDALTARLAAEDDANVRVEIEAALSSWGTSSVVRTAAGSG
jgi:epoxyqueuosine reductase